MSAIGKITKHELYLLDQFAKESITAICNNGDFMQAALVISDSSNEIELQGAVSMLAYAQAEEMLKARRKFLKVTVVEVTED